MTEKSVKRQNIIFCSILTVSFLLILVLNFLTPWLSDDYEYLMQVQQADSFADLFRQEYHQYMTWNGRSVVHLLLRIFLYLPRPVFKVANSAAFTATALLLVRLAVPNRKNDVFALLMAETALWLFSVDISETILWTDGACNYLWGALIILSFMSAVNRRYHHPAAGMRAVASAVLLFLYGILAGWCNENTSGGCLLFVLILIVESLLRKKPGKGVLLAAFAGNITGLGFMVLSPGEHRRASMDAAESYQGILKYLARLQKITLTIRDEFAVLLSILVVCLVILHLQRNRRVRRRVLLYLFLFLATSYALVLTRPTQPRAYFGAGLFLDIAVIIAVRGIVSYERNHPESGTGYILRTGCYGVMAVLVLLLLFHYTDDAAMTARVYRDEQNRIEYIRQKAAEGETEINVFQVHHDFYNDFSAIGKMDMEENASYWINGFYEAYYGVDNIHAFPYDTWKEMEGITDGS